MRYGTQQRSKSIFTMFLNCLRVEFDSSYFETSSRKSLSSVCLARPLHTWKHGKNGSRPCPAEASHIPHNTCIVTMTTRVAAVSSITDRVFWLLECGEYSGTLHTAHWGSQVYRGRRCSGTPLLWGVVLSVWKQRGAVMTSLGSCLLSLRLSWLDWAKWQPSSCTQWISPLKKHPHRTRTNKVIPGS